MELEVRLRFGLLAEPVDPDGAKPQGCGRRDVVEEARAYVDMPLAVGPALREELVPVAARRLVRADLGRDDRELELDPDPSERRLEEVAVGVGEDGEPPTAGSGLLERLRHLRESIPARQRLP